MFPGDHFYIHTSDDLLHAFRRDVLNLQMERICVTGRGRN